MSAIASRNPTLLSWAQIFRLSLCFHPNYSTVLVKEIWLKITLSLVKIPVLLCLDLASVILAKKYRKYFKVQL